MSSYKIEKDFQPGIDRLVNKTDGSAVMIKRLGAEVVGYDIRDKKTGKTIPVLWNNNVPEPSGDFLWKGHATVLFPICGALVDDKSNFHGKPISLGGHGFARKTVFSIIASENKKCASITYGISSNESTRAQFPFDFSFEVTYTLKGNSLSAAFRVANTGTCEMPFQCGWHPGFNTELGMGFHREDWNILFKKGLYYKLHAVVSEKSHLTGKRTPLRFAGAFNWSTPELYYTIFLETPNPKSRVYKFHNIKNGFGYKLNFTGFPHLAIWAEREREYICIEPCQGLDDHEVQEPFEKKLGVLVLEPFTEWRQSAAIHPYFGKK